MGYDTYIHILYGVEIPLADLTRRGKPSPLFIKIMDTFSPSLIEDLKREHPDQDPYQLALQKDDIVNTSPLGDDYFFLYFDDPTVVFIACYHHEHCAGRVPDRVLEMKPFPDANEEMMFIGKCMECGIGEPRFYSVTNVLH